MFVEGLRQSWQKHLAETKPTRMGTEQYQQYLRNLSPEGLVDHLHHFQAKTIRGWKTIATGIGVMGLAELTDTTVDALVRFNEHPTPADTIALLFFAGGAFATLIGAAVTLRNRGNLRFVNDEVERRLVENSPPNGAIN